MAPAKIGRNDPCYCGSGKKYKQCHEPVDRARNDHVRLLRRAQDRLLPKLIDATQEESMLAIFQAGLASYWDGRYTMADMSDLDDHEDHGAERFLTWAAFDALAEDGTTLVERIAADPPAELELDEYERELLPAWAATRLRPYQVTEVVKGQGVRVRDLLLGDNEMMLHDHAAAKRLEPDEVIIGHLVPIGEEFFIAGAAAQTTADTREKLDEFLALQLEEWRLHNPDGALEQFVRERSYAFNHFVLALPKEEQQLTGIDDLLLRGRAAVAMSKAALGFGPDYAADDDEDEDEDDSDEVDLDDGADEDGEDEGDDDEDESDLDDGDEDDEPESAGPAAEPGQ